MREIKEFHNDDNGAWLEVFCYQLAPGEVEELISLLNGFTFQNIQEDALLARVEGDYQEIWNIMEILKKKAFPGVSCNNKKGSIITAVVFLAKKRRNGENPCYPPILERSFNKLSEVKNEWQGVKN